MRIVLFCLVAALLGLNDIEHRPKEEKLIQLNCVRPTHILDYADTLAIRYGIPFEVIWGVGWNESHFGESVVAKRCNNMFGIKIGDNWNGKTSEKYRAYDSRYDSVLDFCEYIKYYYPHLIGKPLTKWYIKGYAEKPYKF